MNDERLVRDVWKQFPHRAVVGERLVRAVGARGWERFRFGRFRRYFERSGVPDPWDPSATDVEIGLGEVGVLGARKEVARHAAPPGSAATAKAPAIPNVPKGMPAAAAKPPIEGKPAPRIGEVRKDDTEILRKKSLEAEKKKVDPARANLFKVNQPVAKLPMRPDVSGEGGEAPRPVARPSAPARPATAEGGRPPIRPPAAVPVRPSSASPIRPFRMPVEASRRGSLPDGPEEVEEPAPVAARAGLDRAYGGFGLGGGWDDDEPVGAARSEVAPPAERAASTPVPTPAEAPVASPPRPPAPAPAAPAPAAPIAQPVAARPPAPPAATPPRPAAPVASAPTTTSAPPRPPAPSVTPASPPRPPAAPPPRPPAPTPSPSAGPPKPGAPPRPARPGGGGLDDLFGMGGGAGGDTTRVRMPKREEADPAKPRRPMVTPDADLGKGGIDRRPPPPKPPSVTPTGGGGAADPEGDGGD